MSGLISVRFAYRSPTAAAVDSCYVPNGDRLKEASPRCAEKTFQPAKCSALSVRSQNPISHTVLYCSLCIHQAGRPGLAFSGTKIWYRKLRERFSLNRFPNIDISSSSSFISPSSTKQQLQMSTHSEQDSKALVERQ